jgi:hypothetical protein
MCRFVRQGPNNGRRPWREQQKAVSTHMTRRSSSPDPDTNATAPAFAIRPVEWLDPAYQVFMLPVGQLPRSFAPSPDLLKRMTSRGPLHSSMS